MNKRITAIGLAAGLLAGVGAGVVLEQSGGAGAAGGRSNFAPAQGDPSVTPPLDTGPDTNAPGDDGPGDDGRGGGLGGRGGRPGRGGFGANLDAVATLLGMSVADLQTALQDGRTLAQIARDHGKTANDVIDALVAALKAHFAAEVASGEHTQAEADQLVAAFTSQISDFVNNGTVFPGRAGPIVGGVPGANGFPGIGVPGDPNAGPNDGGPNGGGPNDGGPIGGLPIAPTTIAPPTTAGASI